MNEIAVTTNEAIIVPEIAPEFSWRAAFAGALVGSAVIFFLLALGAGLGLSLVSVPDGVNATTGTAKSALTLGAIYFFAAQAFGFVVGGYLAGRLMGPVLESEKEENFHASAHGLVAWVLTVVVTATMIATSGLVFTSSGLNGAALLGSMNRANAGDHSAVNVSGYWVDVLFRPAAAGQLPAPALPAAGGPAATTPSPAQNGNDSEARAELGRIIDIGLLHAGQLSGPDHDRAASLVSQYAGADMAEGSRRVNDVQARIHDEEMAAAEAARKLAKYVSLWIAASLIFGALASAGGAVSGRWVDDEARRD